MTLPAPKECVLAAVERIERMTPGKRINGRCSAIRVACADFDANRDQIARLFSEIGGEAVAIHNESQRALMALSTMERAA